MAAVGDISVQVGVSEATLSTISKVLKVNNDAFDVMGQDGNIALVHHKGSNPAVPLRGVVVDLKLGKVITRGLNLFDSVADHLVFDGENLEIVDEKNVSHMFSGFTIIAGYEGLLVRVFKAGGKVYHITNKSLDFSDKIWGNRDQPFGQMWEELKCPSDSDLFGDEENSGVCYHFMMVHKHLQVGSRFMTMNPGFTVLTEVERTCYPATEQKFVADAPRATAEIEHPFIQINRELTAEEANQYLRTGLHPNEPVHQNLLLRNGEFVVVKCNKTGKMVRVMSSGYDYRLKLRNGKGCIYDRFIEHFNEITRNKDLLTEEEFTAAYFPFAKFEAPALSAPFFEKLNWPLGTDMALRLVFRCFLLSLPPCIQPEYSNMIICFFNARRDVSRWLLDISAGKMSYDEMASYHSRIPTIIQQARNFARKYNVPSWQMREAIRDNINYLVGREFAFSLLSIFENLLEERPEGHNLIQAFYG